MSGIEQKQIFTILLASSFTTIHHFDSLAKYGRHSNYNNNNMKWLSQIDREKKKNGSNEYAKKQQQSEKKLFD